MLKIHSQMLPYLSDKGRESLTKMVNSGIDADLALSLLEATVPDVELYDLPPKDEVEQDV
jgi:hypothetical protein